MKCPWWKGKNILFLLLIAMISTTGCQKEYSFEGSPVPVADTIPVQTFYFPSCNSCLSNDTLDLWAWKFKLNNATLCGNADTAIINIE